MRIIANDVTPEMGSEGSNPSLSAQKPAVLLRAFLFSGHERFETSRVLLKCS
jgi:hypothetical protein